VDLSNQKLFTALLLEFIGMHGFALKKKINACFQTLVKDVFVSFWD